MTAKEKKYFEFCGTLPYFVTLAIVLVAGIFCLVMSLPFMLSASICDGNPPEAHQENVDKVYEAYSQLNDGIIKESVAANALGLFLAGVACVCFVASVFFTDTIRCRNIRKRMRKAREEKYVHSCTEKTA